MLSALTDIGQGYSSQFQEQSDVQVPYRSVVSLSPVLSQELPRAGAISMTHRLYSVLDQEKALPRLAP